MIEKATTKPNNNAAPAPAAESRSEAYAAAGVDITAGYRAVELMKKDVARTSTPGVLSGIGGFGGLYEPDLTGISRPVLVSGTDGVGTKLKLAFLLDRHNTVGIDCVAMCVNDVICCGARPLFFLDYIACGKNVPERIAAIVGGVAEGCVRAGCALIGGETAEMPGFYPENEYDLAGYCTGIVDRDAIIDSSLMREGDAILALPSSGVHSNGFSLVRKIFINGNFDLGHKYDGCDRTLGDMLIEPTRIYVRPVLELLKNVTVRGISHITGGGFYENIPRSLPDGLCAVIERDAVRTPPVFNLIAKYGDISERDMFNTYNMGVGMSIVIPAAETNRALRVLNEQGEDAYVIGHIESSSGDEKICIR